VDLNYIFRRRSICRYTDETVTDQQIKYILEAAMAAPSSDNLKPWHFIVIQDRDKLNQIAEKHPHAKMLVQAPLTIVICGDVVISPEYWYQDCAAATENILLALPELGLGGVWIRYHPRSGADDVLKDVIPLPDNIHIFGLVAVSHPDEEKISRSQYEDAKIHSETW